MPVIRVKTKRPTQLALAAMTVLSITLALTYTHSSPSQPNNLPALSTVDTQSGGMLAANARPTAIEGWVKDNTTGTTISGALVSLGDTASTRTDARGHFAFDTSQALHEGTQTSTGVRDVEVRVQAEGYADWTISQAKYYESDILRLYPKMVPIGPASTKPKYDLRPYLTESQAAPQLAARSPGAPPATIRVYRTGTGVVEVVPFRDYVKHVLPHEWPSGWSPESLKAGAMAAKTYAWYWVSRGGKQVALGADVKDNTDDQVYNPDVSYASTDAAVDATFNYAMTINGSLFQSQYCAGAYDADPTGDCPWGSRYMTQWGSKYYADQGKTWGWILGFYYQGVSITPNPPGGGFDGQRPPIASPTTRTGAPPTPVPPGSGSYSVGQGATQPQLFIDAYDRNGGAAVLGRPVTTVQWWLPYLTEHNVLAQRFSGSDDKGNLWIVFDTLKSSTLGVNTAFLISDRIATEYSTHNPPGPEWVGAPTSDPYLSGDNRISQTFRRGLLVDNGSNVELLPLSDAQPSVTPTPVAPNKPPSSGALSGQSNLRVSVQWLGRGDSPSDAWSLPITLSLSAPGNPSILSTYAGKTDRNGVAIYPNLPSGKFDLHVKGPHTLQSARAGITLSDYRTVSIDLKAQIEGDVDGDNCVTVDDFSRVQGLYGTHRDMPGFQPQADLNGDGIVAMDDISLLRSGFERCGDVSADSEFRAMTTNSAPTLSEALSPWLNPDLMNHNLTLEMAASNTSIRAGEIFTLDVIAQTRAQPIDGASFILSYDPQRFTPVDAIGGLAPGMEPGMALPSVMGNWIDAQSGLVGFASGMLQGDAQAGRIVLGSVQFRALKSVGAGHALFSFAPAPSPLMQLTNGGHNLLAKATDITVTVLP